jgi:hypothetical protein
MRSQNTIELRKRCSSNASFFSKDDSFLKNDAPGYRRIVDQWQPLLTSVIAPPNNIIDKRNISK